LWVLVGAGAAVLVAGTLPASAPSIANVEEPAAVWVGLIGLVLAMAVFAYEMAKGVRLTTVRWTLLALTIIVASMVASAVVPAIAAMAPPLGLASLVALVILSIVTRGGKPDKRETFAAPVSAVRVGGPWFGGFRLAGLGLVIGLVIGVGVVELVVARGPHGGVEVVRAPKVVLAEEASVPYDTGTRITHDHIEAKRYALVTEPSDPSALVSVMFIDGNRSATRGLEGDARNATPVNPTYVLFNHEDHTKRLGGATSCTTCHHRNVVLDRSTSCTTCHQAMHRATDTFDHSFHVLQYGGNASCTQCHGDTGEGRTREASKSCVECHGPTDPEATAVRVELDLPEGYAAGYVDAMHGLCIGCHLEEEAARRYEQPVLSRCVTCHPVRPEGAGHGDYPEKTTVASGPGRPGLVPVAATTPEAR
jgi:hypothetical protein